MDEEFRHPRLAALHDALDGERTDLDEYLRIAAELGARRVGDVGCGTGVLARMLAARGCDVVAVDPARASLDVARARPGADRVRWVEGDATALTVADRDLAAMTGNVAQAIPDPAAGRPRCAPTTGRCGPGGHLVLETRDPAARAWEGWTRPATERTVHVPGEGAVPRWVELTEVALPLVTLRWTYRFADGAVLTSTSTLRFRDRAEVEADLRAPGLAVAGVRDAPDRPGRELVFLARRDGW